MVRFTCSRLTVAIALIALSSAAQAQIYVPHTTTHIDLVPHRGHLHAIPHTTTHYDAIPFSNYGNAFGYQPYKTSYGSRYHIGFGNYAPQYIGPFIPAQRLGSAGVHSRDHVHADIVPHGKHYHVLPHSGYRQGF